VEKQQEFVLRTIEERGVKFIRLWFTDVVGTLKMVAVAPAEVEGAFAEGLGIDGSSIEGFTRAFEADVLAHPDPTTFQTLPWRGEIDPTARMFCDISTPDGEPAMSDPRYVLKRALQKAADRGFTFYTHPEIEFYLLTSSDYGPNGPEPVDKAGYFDNVPGGTAHDFRRRAVRMLEDLGISVEFSHHEGGPGQNEIDLRYADALSMADNIMTFRTVVKEVAIEQGVYATFMPKPMAGQNGSGMHVHQSIFKNGENAFFDENSETKLSTLAHQFIGGQLKHIKAMAAILNPIVNSYKRLVPGYEAPTYIAWGNTNRSALIRIPRYTPGREKSTRAELRNPDPSCNPYLAFAVMLAAGLDGIESELTPPPAVDEDIFELDDSKTEEMKIESLPHNLWESTKELEKDEVIRAALGEHAFKSIYAANKAQWFDYKTYVTKWEYDKYLMNH
jgi:glutamine synthetase